MNKSTCLDRRGVVTLLAMGGLGACAAPTKLPNPEFAPIGFPGGPIPMAINNVKVVVRPRVRGDASPADADFFVPPEQIARLWPRQRVGVAGGQNELRYIIDDSSAVSRNFEDGQIVVATIQVRLVIVTPYGIEEAGTGARVESEVRFDGFPNVIERQEALHRVSQDIAAKLDAQLVLSIQQNLGAYIRQPNG